MKSPHLIAALVECNADQLLESAAALERDSIRHRADVEGRGVLWVIAADGLDVARLKFPAEIVDRAVEFGAAFTTVALLVKGEKAKLPEGE